MSRSLDFDDPQDSALALSKIFAGSEAGKPALNWFGGGAFAIRGDLEPIELLFQVEGVTVTSHGGGTSLQIAERHLTLFKDVKGEAFLDRWTNPMSGQSVRVVPAERVNEAAQLSDLMPWYVTGEKAVALIEHHGPGRDSSIQQFVAARAALEDERLTSVSTVGTWQTAAAWWPWMQMDDVEGYLFTRKFTRKYDSAADLPRDLQARLTEYFGEDWI